LDLTIFAAVIVRASGRSSARQRIVEALSASHPRAVRTGLPAFAGNDAAEFC
jgi:hypothetical protein